MPRCWLAGKDFGTDGTKSVEDIEFAVSRLSADELARFRAWFDNFDADAFDRRLERNVESGKLDRLSAQALADYRAGRAREI